MKTTWLHCVSTECHRGDMRSRQTCLSVVHAGASSRLLSPARPLQTIHSARANAVNNFGLNPSKLVIGANVWEQVLVS